jgi:OmpA-OmpF porin, OOP family
MRRLLAIISLGLVSACHPRDPRPVYYEEARGPDSDNDGIADADDRCPTIPEDGYPPLANDGCPTDEHADGDGDGVADAFDRCPSLHEDNLPPDPNDGCPAADRDGDGIADAIDKCPEQPETFNGWEDSDGCPDVPPKTSVVFDPKSFTIFFSASVGFDASAASAAAKLIIAHPEWDRIEIEAHASTSGSAAVTAERAQAATNALVSAGVDARKLVPVGYGDLCQREKGGDRIELKIVRISGKWQDVPRGCWKAKQAGIDPSNAKR